MTSASATTSTHTQPVVVGTIAYYLGKKSDEYHSHNGPCTCEGRTGRISRTASPRWSSPAPVVRGIHAKAHEGPVRGDGDGMGEFDIGVKMEFVDGRGDDDDAVVFPTREEIAKYGPRRRKNR